MATPATGVTSFDVPELLAPISRCLFGMQQQIIEEKLDMLDTLNKDPVPQYTLAQIKKATVFLRSSKQAMRVFLDGFKHDTAEHLYGDELKRNLETARESSRRLVLLLADQQNRFGGSSLQGNLVQFNEGSQSQQVRTRLQSLSSFLRTFSQASWLGDMLQPSNFQQEMELVTNLLNGLLEPKRTPCPPLDDELQKMTRFAQEAGCEQTTKQRVHRFQQRVQTSRQQGATPFYNHPQHQHHPRHHSPWVMSDAAWVGANAAAARNPLESVERMLGITGSSSWKDRMKCLSHMYEVLSNIGEDDGEKKVQLQQQHKAKMAGLKELANELNSVPGVLNQYLLVRLGDIDREDLGQLKAWITHDEATKVHKMLESFRDEAIYERAVRDLSKRNRGTSAREESLQD